MEQNNVIEGAVHLTRTYIFEQRIVESFARFFKNMASTRDVRLALGKKGAIPSLITAWKKWSASIPVVRALVALTSGHMDNVELVTRHGGISTAVQVLLSTTWSLTSYPLLQDTIRLIAMCAIGKPGNTEDQTIVLPALLRTLKTIRKARKVVHGRARRDFLKQNHIIVNHVLMALANIGDRHIKHGKGYDIGNATAVVGEIFKAWRAYAKDREIALSASWALVALAKADPSVLAYVKQNISQIIPMVEAWTPIFKTTASLYDMTISTGSVNTELTSDHGASLKSKGQMKNASELHDNILASTSSGSETVNWGQDLHSESIDSFDMATTLSRTDLQKKEGKLLSHAMYGDEATLKDPEILTCRNVATPGSANAATFPMEFRTEATHTAESSTLPKTVQNILEGPFSTGEAPAQQKFDTLMQIPNTHQLNQMKASQIAHNNLATPSSNAVGTCRGLEKSKTPVITSRDDGRDSCEIVPRGAYTAMTLITPHGVKRSCVASEAHKDSFQMEAKRRRTDVATPPTKKFSRYRRSPNSKRLQCTGAVDGITDPPDVAAKKPPLVCPVNAMLASRGTASSSHNESSTGKIYFVDEKATNKQRKPNMKKPVHADCESHSSSQSYLRDEEEHDDESRDPLYAPPYPARNDARTTLSSPGARRRTQDDCDSKTFVHGGKRHAENLQMLRNMVCKRKPLASTQALGRRRVTAVETSRVIKDAYSDARALRRRRVKTLSGYDILRADRRRREQGSLNNEILWIPEDPVHDTLLGRALTNSQETVVDLTGL